ncbi:T9SS type B sorting domain-containing protein [Brumimicrobium aurantiacum]|uniref:Gliding motility-associated C-terminal domain-containing protein n=1 Tax=Brumimicrobium aurantiacum TaxID=1737063 RepID=A0A3E1EXV0_9FLAO|nr:gliding motility-associated C-terminal domain-containing protein [Brumimicrobium aurantiacum]RFC54386.1 hypothetical protein DXU93_08140 [Brumimicrobium aurantiacum]
MHRFLFFTFFFLLFGFKIQSVHATHAMGGEITWKCQGNGDYVFELKFFRDCNGFDVNTNFETLEVWGHPTITEVQVDFMSRTDISPSCTPSMGNLPFDCGTGASGGNGIGAVEEILYRSNPITLNGFPPANGWHFTYQNFSRSGALTNITSPNTYGVTLTATMFPIPGATGGCIDNSPTFLQSPYVVSCTGEEYNFNPNGVDEDLDSLDFRWGSPLDHFPTGTYNPPTNPAPVPFEPGFSFNNPTPDNTFDPNNQAAQLNPQNGAISFTSFTQGNFATKVMVDAYRNGVKIATVEREIQLIVSSCIGNNSPPTVTPPFAGGTSFDTTIYAGDLINFDIEAIDIENLQDGSPQSVTISSSGLMYGAGFTNANAGCITTPCATLNNAPSVTGVQGATLGFNWQTTCDHLIGASGQPQNLIPYVFVFKVKDDYCSTPKARYVTVTVNVQNRSVIEAPEITCITTAPNGDITINWNTVNDPNGDFDSYDLFGLSGGFYNTYPNINTTSETISNPGAGNVDGYFVTVNSGCGGNTLRSSDTLKNIFLNLNNPGNGEAVLQWNLPSPTQLSHFNDYFHIYQEYPMGTWSLIDSVPYNTSVYFDTISVCEEFLNYQIVLPTDFCDFTSNIVGDTFEDKIVPDIPVITNVNIDSLSNDITINWDTNKQEDTYGYVVYQRDLNGNLVEIDTVFGRTNTSYTHTENLENGPFQYSIAAFDSCYTSNVPPTYQTSAKADPHTTNHIRTSIDACNRLLNINWTGYNGFNAISTHKIHIKTNGGAWQELGQTQANAFNTPMNIGDELIVVVETVSDQGVISFSNKDTVTLESGQGPGISYLRAASVDGENIEIKHKVSLNDGAQSIVLERYNESTQQFEFIEEQTLSIYTEIVFIDEDPLLETDRRSYTYRTKTIDTCNQVTSISNIGKTIFLNVITDELQEKNTLQWTPYEEFIGGLSRYKIYRSVDGIFDPSPIVTLPYNVRTYTDNVSSLGEESEGKICYYVEAEEASNQYGIKDVSQSNFVCAVISPVIYIPNAFTLGGKNPILKPETRQRQIDDYQFEIYDRYGRVIFTTSDPNEGWDGRLKDQSRFANEGVYIYRLSLRDGNGIEVVRHGHVTLLDYRNVD